MKWTKRAIASAEQGLTLLEVILSLVLLSFILLAFFQFFSQSMLFSSRNESDLIAINLARKTLSSIKEEILLDNPTPGTELNLAENYPIPDTKQDSGILYYEENNKKYYPKVEIIGIREANVQPLYPIHITIHSAPEKTASTMLAETYGFMKKGDSQ